MRPIDSAKELNYKVINVIPLVGTITRRRIGLSCFRTQV
jgi:hypothetical protein